MKGKKKCKYKINIYMKNKKIKKNFSNIFGNKKLDKLKFLITMLSNNFLKYNEKLL